MSKMTIDNLHLELRGPQTGLSLYHGEDYVATYVSAMDCLMDLTYRFHVEELDALISQFGLNANTILEAPFVYRGVCSEMFYPTDMIFSYVYYGNKLADIFAKFELHEARAQKYAEHFEYGVQGTGIHVFNHEKNTYEFWVGGNLKSVSDVMQEVRAKNLEIPTRLSEEYALNGLFDVFISHKSEDYTLANGVYEYLTEKGMRVFLSERSLPALANADYISEIDAALEKSRNMIVVAGSAEHVTSGWVKYEWQSFLNEQRSGRKTGNLVVLTAPEVLPADLPYALRQMECIPYDEYERVTNYIV